MARSRRKTATPIASSEAAAGADPAEGPSSPSAAPEDPEVTVEAQPETAPDMAHELAPKADPAELHTPAAGDMAKKAPPEPEKGEERVLLNASRELTDDETPKMPADTVLPKDLKDLAPKVDRGNGGRKLPQYDIRKKAIASTLAKGLAAGTGLPKLPPGHWRVGRTCTLLIKGYVTVLNEGTVISSQTHDIKYLKNGGVALVAVNDRARDMDRHGLDYDPRVTQ
jgi:hypothetical protein